MKWKLCAAMLIAATATALTQSQQAAAPRDDAYVSTYKPSRSGGGPDEKTTDDAFARREAMREQFAGDLTPEFMESLMAAAEAQRLESGPAGRGAVKAVSGGAWANIGPDRSSWIQNGVRVNESDTGRVRTFLVNPANDDVVYVLTSSGGLWKTTNFSAPRPAWRAMTDSILSTSGGSAALGKSPDTIYLGTGDPFDPGVGGFVYKSNDGGENWISIAPLPGASTVRDLKVDASGATEVVLAAANGGLFRSANGGASFTRVAGGSFWSIQRTSAGWLASRVANLCAPPAASCPTGQILISTNQGVTWTVIPNGGNVYRGAGRTTLAVGAPGDNVVYAFAANTGDHAQKDLFRSTDGGLNWVALGLDAKTPVNPNADQPNMDIMAGQAFYNQMLLVDPSDASRNTVYIGGQLSAAKSTDGGASWRIISNWLAQFRLPYVHADFHAAAFARVKGAPALLFGTDGGLFVSNDGGDSFSSQKNDGIASYLLYALASNPKHADDVLIGLQDDGTRLRVGSSGTYNQVFGGDGFGVAWSQADDLVTLGSYVYSFIFRNPRNPPSVERKWLVGWTGIDEFFDPPNNYFVTSIETPTAAADPSGLTYFHRTRFKLYRTTNGAASWKAVFETPTRPGEKPEDPPVHTVALRGSWHPMGVSPVDVNHFGVVGNGGNVWFTNDGGASFTNKVLIGVGGWPGFNAALAYASNTTMYIGNEAPIGTAQRVIKSVDGGNTWAAASSGLPPVPIARLLVSPRDPSGNTVYAATWIGVYETTNGGTSWHLFGQGLPIVTVSDLYMPPDGSYLRVATYGRGVWEMRF